MAHQTDLSKIPWGLVTWTAGILVAGGIAWGTTQMRVSAQTQDLDRLEIELQELEGMIEDGRSERIDLQQRLLLQQGETLLQMQQLGSDQALLQQRLDHIIQLLENN